MTGQLSPDGIALSIVRAAGTHKVTCDHILQACTPEGARPGVRVLIRDGVRDRRCEIVGNDEYDRRAQNGTARPRGEVLTELKGEGGNGVGVTGATASAGAPGTPTAVTLTDQEREDLKTLREKAEERGSYAFSTAAAVDFLIGIGGKIEVRKSGLDRVKALARKGAITYNESTERVLIPSTAPVAPAGDPAKGSTMAMPDLTAYVRTGKVHPLRIFQAVAHAYGLTAIEQVLNRGPDMQARKRRTTSRCTCFSRATCWGYRTRSSCRCFA